MTIVAIANLNGHGNAQWRTKLNGLFRSGQTSKLADLKQCLHVIFKIKYNVEIFKFKCFARVKPPNLLIWNIEIDDVECIQYAHQLI